MKKYYILTLLFLTAITVHTFESKARYYLNIVSKFDNSITFKKIATDKCRRISEYYRAHYDSNKRISRVDFYYRGEFKGYEEYRYPDGSNLTELVRYYDRNRKEMGYNTYKRDSDGIITEIKYFTGSGKLTGHTAYSIGKNRKDYRVYDQSWNVTNEGSLFFSNTGILEKNIYLTGKYYYVQYYSERTGNIILSKRYINDSYDSTTDVLNDSCGNRVSTKTYDELKRLFYEKKYKNGLVSTETRYSNSGEITGLKKFFYNESRNLNLVKLFKNKRHVCDFKIERFTNQTVKRTVAVDKMGEILAEYPGDEVYHVYSNMKCVNCNRSKVYRIPEGLK